jgi:hypothetical protein
MTGEQVKLHVLSYSFLTTKLMNNLAETSS